MRGLYTAVVTPFLTDGSLDIEGLKNNIRFQINEGVDGIVVLGTTGESPTLTHDENKVIIQTAVQEAKGKIQVLVGTGSYATQNTINNTQEAEALGADGALIVAPYYNKPTQEGLYLHFKAISGSSKLPIVVYNIQGRTGQNIQTSTLKRLMDLETIVAVKEASGNVGQIMDVIYSAAQHRPEFTVLSGDDILTFALMSLGGHGVISVASNLIPAEVKALVDALSRDEMEAAREKHYQLMEFFKAIFVETNPIPIKAAMNYCGGDDGLAAGPCRLPLCGLMPENQAFLEKVIDTMQLAKDSAR